MGRHGRNHSAASRHEGDAADRVRERLRDEDGALGAQQTEALLLELTGLDLAAWLRRRFFDRHIRQFKYRPIAWHLASNPASSGTKRKGGGKQVPAFECLVYYHRTGRDLLTRERAWDVDINDGVRVNVVPVQLASLLATEILKESDARKAIADRARWRADERRWVREGVLPRCGWMPEDIPESPRWTERVRERDAERIKLERKRAEVLAKLERTNGR